MSSAGAPVGTDAAMPAGTDTAAHAVGVGSGAVALDELQPALASVSAPATTRERTDRRMILRLILAMCSGEREVHDT